MEQTTGAVATRIVPSAREVLLTAQPSSVREARLAVSRYADCHCLGEDITDAAKLLVSETVTNALVHTQTGEVLLRMALADSTFRVEVTDRAAAFPRRRDAGLDAEGGRGLALLDAMASEWGCEPRAGGKVVWFELALV